MPVYAFQNPPPIPKLRRLGKTFDHPLNPSHQAMSATRLTFPRGLGILNVPSGA
jgi:hypothetical protein